ncbi:hypothetical protein C8F04DRAFT_1064222 [Mycena alexandri]|uniref:EthD domain-containing protein n=1 Tax=Mycena alexandri TaxID=1745969 RepID=A0AAD6TK43_9AGAR|nr:hypothetical protein C8F04DRAFT_1064222 [Mycena alexandri]
MSERKVDGLVCLYFEPLPGVPEDDVNDWFLEIAALLELSEFATAAKYKGTGLQTPGWMMLYDVDTSLTAGMSPEQLGSENELTAHRGSLSCRTYSLIGTAVSPETSAEDLPGKFALTASFEIAPENEEDFNAWYDQEHMAMVARIPGWKRGRRYRLMDAEQIIKGQVLAELPPKYLAIHELDNGNFEKSVEMREARETEWAQRIIMGAIRRQVRAFRLQNFLGGETK